MPLAVMWEFYLLPTGSAHSAHAPNYKLFEWRHRYDRSGNQNFNGKPLINLKKKLIKLIEQLARVALGACNPLTEKLSVDVDLSHRPESLPGFWACWHSGASNSSLGPVCVSPESEDHGTTTANAAAVMASCEAIWL